MCACIPVLFELNIIHYENTYSGITICELENPFSTHGLPMNVLLHLKKKTASLVQIRPYK